MWLLDGTKIKASNNKKMNFSRKKLTARLAQLDAKIAAYLAAAEEADSAEAIGADTAPAGLSDLLSRKELYEGYLAQIDEKAGILAGVSGGGFLPQNGITRAEAAAVVARMIDFSLRIPTSTR